MTIQEALQREAKANEAWQLAQENYNENAFATDIRVGSVILKLYMSELPDVGSILAAAHMKLIATKEVEGAEE